MKITIEVPEWLEDEIETIISDGDFEETCVKAAYKEAIESYLDEADTEEDDTRFSDIIDHLLQEIE